MDHKQQQSLNEAIMQQVFGSSPPPSSPSSTIDESKMAELHSLIQDGKTAQQISKIMNIALSTIKMLMKDFNKEEALSSSSIDEDNTAAVAKQVKKAVKEYTSGKLVVRSKGGKSRFIMVRADKIDNKLREMMADVMYPKANIHDRDDISYGNISSMIISAGTDAWIEALGLKEEEAATELDEAFDMKKMLKIFNKLKKNDTIKIKYDSSISKGKEFQTFVVTSPKRTVGKRGVERVIMKHVDNPTGVKYTLYNRDGSVSLAIGDMAASMTDIKESVGCGGCGGDTEHSFLDEGLVLASDDLNAVKKAAQKLSKQSPDLTYYVVKHKDRHFKGKEIPYYEVYASVDWHMAKSMGAEKVEGYGAKVDMRESVLLDEANHDQRAADKALFNAMKVVDPKARWKMVKTDPSRFGVDVEITSQKMAKYGDWTLMAWSDGKLMHLHYDHPNGEGSVPEKDFKRIAKDMMKESVNKYTQEQQGHLMPKLSGLPGPRPFNNKKNESVELGEAINRGNEAFWKEIHIELKKVMDNKYYREFRSSNGGQALDNVISHFGKARGWRVDRVVKEIIDKYGRNRDEYIKLSFAMAARSRIKESTQIDEKVMGAAYPKGHPMRKFETPASPQTKKLIEGGKAKILKQVTSVLGDTTKFVVIENPTGAWHTGGNQDKVLMATISDPKRGRIKMFAFHGSHISIAKAMQFAINNKLVVTTKMESVELDEKVDGWIAIYNRKKLEIPNDGKVKGILGAKQLAIKHFKVPKSKQGMLAIKPATNESTEHEDTKPDMSKPIAATVDEIVARAAEAIGRGKAFGGWTDSVEKVKNDITADENSPDSPEV